MIRLLLKILLALAAMAGLLLYLVPDAGAWFDWNVYHRVLQLTLWVGGGALVYFLVLRLTGIRLRQYSTPE